jgi:hypothetical protein
MAKPVPAQNPTRSAVPPQNPIRTKSSSFIVNHYDTNGNLISSTKMYAGNPGIQYFWSDVQDRVTYCQSPLTSCVLKTPPSAS